MPATLPATAAAAVFTGHGHPFELVDYPIPVPGAGEILVKIACATICGSDVHTWHGRRIEPTPCVLGHEAVGTIIGFGDGVARVDLRGDPLSTGDRVTWTLAASCGECFFCKAGLPQKCESLFKYGHAAIRPGHEFTGGFAQYCLLAPGTGVIRVPAGLADAVVAPANCAVATVAAALRVGGPVTGAVVAVIGCGVLGIIACAMARAMGAAEVIACDVAASRGAIARRFGAGHFAAPDDLNGVCLGQSDGRGADLAIELSGSAQGVATAIAALRVGGTAVIAGTVAPTSPVALDPQMLIRRMLTIKGLHNYAPVDLVTAIDFLDATKASYPYAELQAENFPLADIESAFACASRQPGKRVAIRPDAGDMADGPCRG